jgi:hypothetical protein
VKQNAVANIFCLSASPSSLPPSILILLALPYTFSTRFGVVVVLVVGVQLKRRCPNSASIVLILSRAKKLVPESAPKGV